MTYNLQSLPDQGIHRYCITGWLKRMNGFSRGVTTGVHNSQRNDHYGQSPCRQHLATVCGHCDHYAQGENDEAELASKKASSHRIQWQVG